MDYGLILAVVAIIVTIIVAVLRSQGSKKQRLIMEQQLAHQREELRMLRELVESFNRLTSSYDTELESMRTQLLLTSGDTDEPVDEATRAVEIEMEREKQKAEKKRQKAEAKRIKKMMKSLEKGDGPSEG
jgi:biopolymer transport protein ExbB/TolQ